MADIIFGSTFAGNPSKLATPIVQKFAECWELDDRIKKLKEVLPLAQAILEDAEEQQTIDKSVKIWVSKLKDAAYRAEDLLEEFVYKSNLKTYAMSIGNRRMFFILYKKKEKTFDKLYKRRETGSFDVSSEVFGRGEKRRKIVLAYNDDEVRKHFDLRIWVFVSDEFNVKNILKAAIESTTAKKCELSEKRYLLVLDDVWSDDQEDWDMIMLLFSTGFDGSKILLTSHRPKVAFMMESTNLIHSIKRLPKEDTWALFKRYAVHNVKEYDCQNLLPIGKEISRKCVGVPLAANVEWLYVKNNNIRHASLISDYRSCMIPKIFIPLNIFSNFIHLRVLDLSGFNINLPKSIDELRSLKYLKLSNTDFQELPSSISSFHSLMTLNLFGSHSLKMFPDLGRVTSLRHLIIDGCEALTQMPYPIKQLVHLQILSIFIVSLHRYNQASARGNPSTLRKKRVWKSSISDLQFLNLRGQLKIKHLEYVSDAEEAEAATIKDKAHLESLWLCSGSDGTDLIMNPALTGLKQRNFQIQGSLQESQTGASFSNLQPHENLKILFIVGYPDLSFPHWKLPRVTKVVLIKCRGYLHVLTVGHLPFLRILHLEGMHLVQRISQEFYALDGREMFPKPRKLTLCKCPSLISVPLIPTIQELKLKGCNPAILGCFKELTLIEKLLGKNHPLKCLKISSCPNLQCLPPDLGSLTFLKSLTLRWCWELFSLPKGFQNLTSLESLEISNCTIWFLFQKEGGIRSLRTLSVENCSNLASINIGLQSLTAFEHLTIMYCPSLSVLPDGMGHLLSLKSLIILSCRQIEFLPEELKYVKTLQCLEIRSCCFARMYEIFTSSFRGLSVLQHLFIQDCPHLQIRCKQDGGVDWWKISHVPYRHIFSSQPQRSGEAASSSSSY
ncbi:unnamed protein product [Withania somnifera]